MCSADKRAAVHDDSGKIRFERAGRDQCGCLAQRQPKRRHQIAKRHLIAAQQGVDLLGDGMDDAGGERVNERTSEQLGVVNEWGALGVLKGDEEEVLAPHCENTLSGVELRAVIGVQGVTRILHLDDDPPAVVQDEEEVGRVVAAQCVDTHARLTGVFEVSACRENFAGDNIEGEGLR